MKKIESLCSCEIADIQIQFSGTGRLPQHFHKSPRAEGATNPAVRILTVYTAVCCGGK